MKMANTLPLFGLLIVLTNISARYTDSDGYTLFEEFNAYYKFYGYPEYLYMAILRCLSEKAQLFYPVSQSESETIFRQNVPANIDSIRVGIHDYIGLNSYRTIDGKSDFHAKLDGNKSSEFNYVFLLSNLTYRTDYDRKAPYVCKKKLESCPDTNDHYRSIKSFNASYKYVNHGYWFLSVLSCLMDGADMFYPSSLEESKAVFDSIIPNEVDAIKIGIHNYLSKRQYETMDGEIYFYSDWEVSQPTRKYQHLVTLRRNLKFSDNEPSVNDKSVCVKRKQVQVGAHCLFSNCELINVRDKIYEFHSNAATWMEAGKYCNQKSSFLAIPGDKFEVSAILNHLKKKCSRLMGTWLGFNNLNASTEYVDVKGHCMKQNAYEWIEEKSRCSKKGCGSVAPTGFLTVQDCTTIMPFVCEYKSNYLHDDILTKAYSFRNATATWHEAVEACNTIISTLTMPRDQAKATALSKYIKNNGFEPTGTWLGFFNVMEAANYVNLKDDIIDYDRYSWIGGKDERSTQGCGFMASSGQLAVRDCIYRMPFMCEFETGYVDLPQIGKSYKFSFVQRSWYEARKSCRGMNATLAMPANMSELRLLTNSMEVLGVDTIFVGFHTLFGPRRFVTLNVLKRVTDDLLWASVERDATKSCGALAKDGLQIENCDAGHYYFCERRYETPAADQPDREINEMLSKGANLMHVHWVMPY